MKTFMMVLAFAMVPALVVAEDSKKVTDEITKMVVSNTVYEDTKLEGSFKTIADAVKKHLKEATFKVNNGTLLVGVKHDAIQEGVEFAKIEFKSDCPDNSQYSVQPLILTDFDRKAVKDVLFTWTQIRHESDAELRVVNIFKNGRTSNYDVQLDIEYVVLR
jgi:hypothetical protein